MSARGRDIDCPGTVEATTQQPVSERAPRNAVVCIRLSRRTTTTWAPRGQMALSRQSDVRGSRPLAVACACLLACLVGIITSAMPAMAQNAASSGFDHSRTGFPLVGAHRSADCTSCHINGRFKGTPQRCAACHNGAIAIGKPIKHPSTTNRCESCHITTAFRHTRYDHTQGVGQCAGCHNGHLRNLSQEHGDVRRRADGPHQHQGRLRFLS